MYCGDGRMDGLQKKLRTEFQQIPDDVQELLRKYSVVVGDLELFGDNPRVYLVGEYHTEEEHAQFTCDLVEILSPCALFAEFTRKTYYPEKQHLTFAEILESHEVGYMHDYFSKTLKEVSYEELFPEMLARDKKDSLCFDKYQKDPASFLKKRTYDYTMFDVMLFDELVSNAIINRTKNRRQEFLNRIDLLNPLYEDPENNFDTIDKAQLELFEIHSMLATADHDEALKWMKKNTKKNGHHFLSAESFNLFRVLGYLTDTIKGHLDYVIDSQSALSEVRNQYSNHLRVEDACNFVGAQLCLFDDLDAKEIYGKDVLPASEVNQIRETAMSNLLGDYLDNNSGVVVTYSGSHHVRSDSPVLETLKEKDVSYLVIRLELADKSPESRFTKGLSYALETE